MESWPRSNRLSGALCRLVVGPGPNPEDRGPGVGGSTVSESPSLHRQVQPMPPSAKFVFKVLEYRGALTRRELARETQLPDSTITDALSALRDAGLLDDRPLPTDPRAQLYYLDP